MSPGKTKPNLLLVIPNVPASSCLNSLAAGITQPLGMAYVANFIRQKGYSVMILGNCVDQLSTDEFAEYLHVVNPDIIGFTATTTTLSFADRYARICKEEVANDYLFSVSGNKNRSFYSTGCHHRRPEEK